MPKKTTEQIVEEIKNSIKKMCEGYLGQPLTKKRIAAIKRNTERGLREAFKRANIPFRAKVEVQADGSIITTMPVSDILKIYLGALNHSKERKC